jgi:threonylcarbamoyladenosine tRNA methylthiotransferase MtaB
LKYSVITFGCRVNQADSLGFEEQLMAAGGEAAPPECADLVVVNTCSVTATSDQGARQTIRRVARNNPSARIVVTGCYATRRPEDLAGLPNVARVIPNDDKPRLIQLTVPSTGDGPCGATVEPGVAGRTAYTLRVQTGCDEPCTYCIIPSTRGASRSVSLEQLVIEVTRVTAAGFKEIALTGVHLGSYGRDLVPRASLVELLRTLNGTDRDVIFRLSSLEPMDCTAEIVNLVAASDKFAPHFHLPLQHASNRVLVAMRRPYTIEYYAALVDDIRARIPNASIGSDIIVGFPGEGVDDFEQLAAYLERSPLTHIHVFPYSDRPGTAATALTDKVHGAEIRERARRIRDIGARLTQRFRDSQIGTVHSALTIDDGSMVVTGNYQKLRIETGRLRNEWVRVRVTSQDAGELLAG